MAVSAAASVLASVALVVLYFVATAFANYKLGQFFAEQGY